MKYYRNAVLTEWVSDEPWGDEAEDLQTVSDAMNWGGVIGYVTRTVTNQELNRDKAIELDISYGGDGTFIIAGEEDEDGDAGGTDEALTFIVPEKAAQFIRRFDKEEE